MQPVQPQLFLQPLNEQTAQFIVEPLDPGFGYSLGSALRRVLLSSIEGCALTAVRVEGVAHEFSTLPLLREDVTELLLNLRECRFRSESDKGRWDVRLVCDHSGEIKAKDFQLPAGLEIVNPEKVVGHLDSGGSLTLDGIVETGRGFEPAEGEYDDPIGTIRLDANFSPVERVGYEVSAARVGQRTDYDKLVLTVKTDNTRSSQEVIEEAVRILQGTLDVFLTKPVQNKQALEGEVAVERPRMGMETLPIEELELGVRSFNCLRAAGVETLGDLTVYREEELAEIPNFGKKSFQEVLDALKERNLSLKG